MYDCAYFQKMPRSEKKILFSDSLLGSGIVVECEDESTDGSGNIHIKSSVDTGSLPIEEDANFGNGAKIFLVPSVDVDCDEQVMIGWTGDDANLYEGALITFIDTDEDTSE